MIFETFLFLVAGIGALFITGFAVHMFVGGLVSPETENEIIAVVCIIVFCAIAYMVWDVIQRRANRK